MENWQVCFLSWIGVCELWIDCFVVIDGWCYVAMVSGGTTREVTQLNIESLWVGGPFADPVRLIFFFLIYLFIFFLEPPVHPPWKNSSLMMGAISSRLNGLIWWRICKRYDDRFFRVQRAI